MSIKTTIDLDRNLVTQETSDELTTEEILSAFEQLYLNPEFQPSMSILTLVTPGSTASINSEAINQLVNLMRKYADKRGGGRSAVVAADASDYGLSHVVEFLLKDELRDVKVFNNIDDAMTWLNL
ncbi:MAG: hypothetical protein GXP13_08640, partial [Gammaproteobacteria bacterium]|nr:hypothetical protein [Gammaproteobacteria bacterium]